MPSAKILSEKQAIVEKLAQRMQNAGAGVFVNYMGVNVAQDMEIRREFSANGIDYSVIKNTLTRFAIKKAGLEEIDPVLNGTTSLATTAGDPIAPFRIVGDYTKKLNGLFSVKAGFMDGRVLTADEIANITALQSKDALYAKVLGTMIAPVAGLAVCIAAILEKKQPGAVIPASSEPEEAAPEPADVSAAEETIPAEPASPEPQPEQATAAENAAE